MSISVHPLNETDIVATDEVIKEAYNVTQSRQETLYRYLALQPDGVFLAKEDGRIVGFGGAIDYGTFAYIGLMSVHPTMQRRGVGQIILERLLDWADTRGCATVLLDASPAGAPLYARYSFMEDDTTVVLRQTQKVEVPRLLPDTISLLQAKDFPMLLKFDTPYFGADRGALLASYRSVDPQRALVANASDGQISGYLFAQSGTLGPWVARTADTAEQLLVYALTLPFKSDLNVFVSINNSDALRLLARYGFSQQRTLSHMWKGKSIQRSRTTALYGQTSLGFG